ncbi:hypothetical protein EZS27_016308, partial [termite gut metagenome]
LSNTATVSYKWAVRRQQPQISIPQRGKERKTIFGCVSPLSGELVTQIADKGNTKTFFSLLFKVAEKYKRQKVYMVLDNVRFHHAKRLKPVLERYSHRMELVFLPPYSPDLNPIERVWWLMRKRVTHNRWVKTMGERVDELERWCETISPLQIKTVCNLIENIY